MEGRHKDGEAKHLALHRTILRIMSQIPGLALKAWCRKSSATSAHMQEQFLEGAFKLPISPDCSSLPWFGVWGCSAELGWCTVPGNGRGSVKRQTGHIIQLYCILPTELETPDSILSHVCSSDKWCKMKRDLASRNLGSIFCLSLQLQAPSQGTEKCLSSYFGSNKNLMPK